MTFNEFAAKKVLGVPVLYVAGAAVIILAIVAYRMKASSAPADTPAEGAPDAGTTDTTSGDPYDGFETKGTVIVSPNPVPNPDQELANQSIQTNQEWLVKATQYLITKNNVTGTTAQSALTKYLDGQDRSYDENALVDAVIKEFGLPPDGTSSSGTVGPKPVAKQFTGAGTHTVQGSSDNTASSLAALYYGSNAQDRIDLIEAANLSKGAGPWGVGTKISVPEYHVPKYYTTPTSGYLSAKNLAAKQGVSLDKLSALNNPKGGAYSPEYRFGPGTRVRVD